MMKNKIKENHIIQKVDNKITIFDPEESILYTFNETASFIFQVLKKNKSHDEIVKLVIKKYNVSQKKADEDLRSLIEELKSNGILQ